MSDHPKYPSYPGDDGPAPGSGQQQPADGQAPSQGYGQAPLPGYGQTPPQDYGQAPPGYGQTPGQGYGQPPPGYAYGYPLAPVRPPSTKAVFSLVLGISSIVLCFIGVLVGPVAIILSVLARREIDAGPAGVRLAPGQPTPPQVGRGMTTAGLVTGIIGTSLWGVMSLLLIIGLSVE